MFVTVFHGTMNRSTHELENHEAVATFSFPVKTVDEALDLGYFHTQNLHDSWSETGSQDAHYSLQLRKPREVIDGEEFGHRSSMVGDLMKVYDPINNGHLGTYVVEDFGFKKVD